MKKHTTYCVLTWDDSLHYQQTWIGHEQVDLEPTMIATCGILVKENKKTIALAVSTHDDMHLGVVEIPKGCIREIKKIKFPLKHKV